MNELAGKRALVTGSTSGIGRAAARALAARGATVVVHGRDPERGSLVVKEIQADGGDARFVAADLNDPLAVSALALDVGDLDILVNNAGAGWFGPSADLRPDRYDVMFSANVRSAYLLTAAMVPRMAGRGAGSVINVGSAAGTHGIAGGAAYGATKAALGALTRAWAAEFGAAGVRVNTVSPGPVYTNGASTEEFESTIPDILLGRVAQPEEIGEVIAFLAGPGASYVTGANIPVDGGQTAA